MTCPSCSRSTRDYTNSSGLVARCDAPYHAAADLCGTPNAHHPGCPVFRNLACDCGAAKALPDASKDSHSWQPPTPERIDALRIAESLANARPLEPAQNGFRWCHDCESVQPAAGHECVPAAEWVEDCRMCHFPVLSDGHGLVCSGCASEEDRKRVIRRAARGGGR